SFCGDVTSQFCIVWDRFTNITMGQSLSNLEVELPLSSENTLEHITDHPEPQVVKSLVDFKCLPFISLPSLRLSLPRKDSKLFSPKKFILLCI
ncbi:hypothetical protein NPIL_369591, partial [Nephila pilipes]